MRHRHQAAIASSVARAAHCCPRMDASQAAAADFADCKRGIIMRGLLGATLLLALAATSAAADDIVLRGMGSFHVGGRVAEVTGKEVRMIQRQPGGPMTKLDPNGQYMVEQ